MNMYQNNLSKKSNENIAQIMEVSNLNRITFYTVYSLIIFASVILGNYLYDSYGLKTLVYYLASIGFLSLLVNFSVKMFMPIRK